MSDRFYLQCSSNTTSILCVTPDLATMQWWAAREQPSRGARMVRLSFDSVEDAKAFRAWLCKFHHEGIDPNSINVCRILPPTPERIEPV